MCQIHTDIVIKPTRQTVEKCVWQTDIADIFRNNTASQTFRDKITMASNYVETDINVSLKMFNESILDAADCMKKSFVVDMGKENRNAKWFDKECCLKKKEVRRQLRLFNRTKKKEDYNTYSIIRKEYKALIENKKREDKKLSVAALLESVKSSQDFWKEMRKHRKRKTIVNNISENDWISHFETVLNENANYDCELESVMTEADNVNNVLNSEISELEIRKVIKQLKTRKAAGPDCILGEMLRTAEPEIIKYLRVYFNKLFADGVYPEEWTKAIIVPLHKKGDINNPDNYRGISLLSVLS